MGWIRGSSHVRIRLVPVLALAALAACAGTGGPASPTTSARTREAPMTAERYGAYQAALRSDPRLRASLTAECVAEVRPRSKGEVEMMSALLAVEAGKVVATFCERTIAAIARGDVSYEDYAAVKRGAGSPETMRRLVRALRQGGDELVI